MTTKCLSCYDSGCMFVWWLAASPHSKRVSGLNPNWDLSSWSLHVLPVYVWVLSRYFGFLPPPKNMHIRLIKHTCFFVSFVSVWPCDGRATCPGCTLPLTQWQLGQALRPQAGLSWYRKWMGVTTFKKRKKSTLLIFAGVCWKYNAIIKSVLWK